MTTTNTTYITTTTTTTTTDERAMYTDRAGHAADFIGDHQLSTYLELFASLWQRT